MIQTADSVPTPDSAVMSLLQRYAAAQRANARKVRATLLVVFVAAIIMFVSAPILTQVEMSEDLELIVALVFLASFTTCMCGIVIAAGFAIFRQPMLDEMMAV